MEFKFEGYTYNANRTSTFPKCMSQSVQLLLGTSILSRNQEDPYDQTSLIINSELNTYLYKGRWGKGQLFPFQLFFNLHFILIR